MRFSWLLLTLIVAQGLNDLKVVAYYEYTPTPTPDPDPDPDPVPVDGPEAPALIPTQERTEESYKTIESSAKWRIYSTNAKRICLWDIINLEFYSNFDCTGTKFNGGKPIDSAHLNEVWDPAKAFDSFDYTAWGGRFDADRALWLGLDFGVAKDVKCVSILDNEENGVLLLRVQAWEDSTGTWQDVMISKDFQSGVRNTVSLGAGALSGEPTAVSSSLPSLSAAIPTETPTMISSMTPTRTPTRTPTSSEEVEDDEYPGPPALLLLEQCLDLCHAGMYYDS
jgi:hypothetical protein